MVHPYHLEAGLLARVGEVLRADGFSRCAVITDENVAAAWRTRLEEGLGEVHSDWLVIPPGEEQKSLERTRRLYSALLELGVDRNTPVLAFGGGVVGDLTGFVAATLLRGLPLYHLPTTLTAMVDASIGGKAAVDLPEGKNLVGAFYAPRAVLADPGTLSTLPLRGWASGMAEVIKHALLASPELFERVEELEPPPSAWSAGELQGLLEHAARVKLDIVARDPTEQGERSLLNLGHTFAHAYEAAGGYRLLHHGEAVALGLLSAVRLSRRLGLLEEDCEPWLVRLLRLWDLPRMIPTGLEWPAVWDAMGRDKKRREGKHRFVVPLRVGRAQVVSGVEEGDVRSVFESLLEGGRGAGFHDIEV